MFKEADHAAVPRLQAPRLPALPRPAPPPLAPRERARGNSSTSLCAAACPADCIGVVADENSRNASAPGRAVRGSARIGLSRCIFCGYCRLAYPFDAITRSSPVRASRNTPRRPHLHEGHAPRGARETDAGRRSRALRHSDPGLEVQSQWISCSPPPPRRRARLDRLDRRGTGAAHRGSPSSSSPTRSSARSH